MASTTKTCFKHNTIRKPTNIGPTPTVNQEMSVEDIDAVKKQIDLAKAERDFIPKEPIKLSWWRRFWNYLF